ncbi:MAG: METTL5 family protein [Methanocorpusculum sp.]|jgi:putative methylase|nr:METTL5 family protein [Methanocorpusculum sp.]MDD4424196.1 METTL5 family protein [Methanocorpusculum parvum]MDD2803500.1 METTL5 family protein [Methanocorpusculum sp.]MDD3047207.1 METTL5 family protein [Methanocorpusculum sp.]MDD3912564.1 METTL5 family protein [Methanocorpusculum sp.]
MKLRQLEMCLQKIQGFRSPKADIEQYMTPAPLAARLLHEAALAGDICEMKVVDLGCGTGMLSIGAALLGAEVTGIDIDEAALKIARKNAEAFGLDIEWIRMRIDETAKPLAADTVIMNPPFGAQKEHADRPFIDFALLTAPVCYGIFNKGSIPFLEAYTKNTAVITAKTAALLNIPKQFAFHTQENLEIPVEIVRLERIA